jgi:hypothetical protein
MLDKHWSETKQMSVDICSMVDKYLRNAILKRLRGLNELEARIESAFTRSGAPAAKPLMEQWASDARALYPYLAEAMLRTPSDDLDVDGIRAALQETIGRSGPVSSVKVSVSFSAHSR